MASSWVLGAAATTLREHAQRVSAAWDGVASASGLDTWQGPAATRFAFALAARVEATQQAALGWLLMAAELDESAARARLAELADLGWVD